MKLFRRLAVRESILPFLLLLFLKPLTATAQEGTNDFSWLKLIPPGYWLDSWSFDTTNFSSDFGFAPLTVSNVQQVPDWDGEALQVDSANAAWLTYAILPSAPGFGQYTNLTLDTGTIEFWFIANWESADTNFYGTGPGDWGRFIDFTNNGDWWSLYLNPSGTGVCFSSGTNGASTNYLCAPISWDSSVWHLVDLTYSPSNSFIYLDGQLAATGDGVRYVPRGEILTNGFSIGSDFATGMQQAHGQFDDLATYNYQLSADDVADDYAEAYSELQGTFHPMDDGPPIPPGGTNDGGGGDYGAGGGGNFSIPTNGLWLWVANIAAGAVYADLHNGTDYVYEIFSATNLATATPLPNWSIEAEVFPTNTSVVPFTVPMGGRDQLFLSARDWTGITSDGNTTPEWWFYLWYKTIDLHDWDYDSIGNTLLYDYLYGLDPLSPGTYDRPPEYVRPPYAYWNVTDISDPAQPVNIGVLQEPFSEPHYSGLGAIPLPNTLWHFNTSVAVTNAYGTTEFGGVSNMGTVFEIGVTGGVTTLHSFTNLDGAYPCSQVAISGSTYYGLSNVLYGTTAGGGSNGYGTVFKVNADGSGFADLHEFSGTSDGKFPKTGLLIDGNTLYGTTSNSIFKISTCGCDFTCLTNVANASQLILSLSGDTLFGTTTNGGASNEGRLFSISTAGTNLLWLHDFTGGTNDGAFPVGGLEILECSNTFIGGLTATDVLFGVAYNGGARSNGMVFSINTDGSGFMDLHDFKRTTSDGANPMGGLLLTNNNILWPNTSNFLYGTTSSGGASDAGTIFGMNVDGSGFTNLYSFGGTNGASPDGKLVLVGQTLFGSTSRGGVYANGTVFSINNDGSNFTSLYDFAGGTNGGSPATGLALPVVDNLSSIWSLDTSINVSALDSTNLSYSLAIDDSYALFVNGKLVNSTNSDGEAFWLPYSPLPYLRPGVNDIRVAITANGDANDYFAMQIRSPFTNPVLLTNVFGTTSQGGSHQFGTLFELTRAGSETRLYDFSGGPLDGKNPIGDLILSDNTLYGVTEYGGINDHGTIFRYDIGSSNCQVLYRFDGDNGELPTAGLLLIGNKLYGTTSEGGQGGDGTLFSYNIGNSNYQVLLSFGTNSDGASPQGSLVVVSNVLYGTASGEAANGDGDGYSTIFSYDIGGSNYQTLYYFGETTYDGLNPLAGLTVVSNAMSGVTLYGTTAAGGSNYDGTIFSYNIGSLFYTNVYSFGGAPDDGMDPEAGLVLSGNTLYGTAHDGGPVGYGTIFSIGVDGNGYATFLPFGSDESDGGDQPQADLSIQGNLLCGTTYGGSTNGGGMVFCVDTNGNYSDIYHFKGPPDGKNPEAGICSP